MEEKEMEALVKTLTKAKRKEDESRLARIEAEEAIIKALGGTPIEGTATHNVGGYKVKVEQRINRKIDERKYHAIKDEIPEALRPISIVETLKIDTAGLRWLKENEPGYWKILADAITETPAKPSVKIEEA